MTRRASITVGLVAVAVPVLLVGNALLVLLVPWLPAFQYALPGFPADAYGLTGSERLDLANTGVRSIWPVGPGPDLLESARLPDGRLAFTRGEVTHMEDVRAVVRGALGAWVVALAAFVGGVLLLRRRSMSASAFRGIFIGGVVTIGLVLGVAVIGLVSFDFFFDTFHAALFERGTWEFSADSTLIRLYPERFWMTAALFGAVLVIVQAAIAVWIGRAHAGPGGPSR